MINLQEVNDRFEEIPYEINNGSCEQWAELAYEMLSSQGIVCGIWETVFAMADTIHFFLQCQGKFYDAECLTGVEDFMQLPIFAKLDRPQPVVFSHGNTVPTITAYNATDDELVEAGYTPMPK